MDRRRFHRGMERKQDRPVPIYYRLRSLHQNGTTENSLTDKGRIARSADDSGYPPRLEVLAQGIVDLQSVKGERIYLLRQLPRDPLAPPETVPAAATWSLRSYASTPEDPKPGRDVFDVHSNSPAIGLNGVPYKVW